MRLRWSCMTTWMNGVEKVSPIQAQCWLLDWKNLRNQSIRTKCHGANTFTQLIEWCWLVIPCVWKTVSFRRWSHRCFVQPEGRRILHSSWAQGENFSGWFLLFVWGWKPCGMLNAGYVFNVFGCIWILDETFNFDLVPCHDSMTLFLHF